MTGKIFREGRMRCLKCGAELAESDKFCYACGVPIEEEGTTDQGSAVKCSRCGETADKADKFCSYCGQELQVQKISAAEKTEVSTATAGRNPHPIMTFLGYVNVFICSVLIIMGGLILHGFAGDDITDDTGFLMTLWATFGLILGIGIFGGYLLSRKKSPAKRHGKTIVFLSLFMLGVFLISFIAAVIRFE